MPATISAQERDALFAQIRLAFYAFDDLERAIDSGDLELAYKTGRRVSDGLRLILDGGLGFAQRIAEPVTFAMPDEELRPIMGRLKAEIAALYESRKSEFDETQQEEAAVAGPRDACAAVLNQL